MLIAYAPALNVHLHCLVLDGVYWRDADGVPAFVEVDAVQPRRARLKTPRRDGTTHLVMTPRRS